MDTIESVLKKMENYPSFEILPPIDIDGRCRVVGINIYPNKRTIEITFHTIPVEEKYLSASKRSEITDFTRISFRYEDLKWLAPRLDGLREAHGIESGYDIINKQQQKPQ